MKINKISKLITIGFVTFIIVFSFLLGVGSLISHLKAGKVSHANYSTQDISVDLKTDIINNEKEFIIDTAEDMYNFAYWYSNLKNEGGFDKSNVYFRVKLTNNIDMSTVKDLSGSTLSYYPIVDFYGEFDGQNHTISNLIIKNSNVLIGNLGLFASIKGKTNKYSEIKNITILNYYFSQNLNNSTKDIYSGGIVGYSEYCNIIECKLLNFNNLTTTITYTGNKYFDNLFTYGGIVGFAKRTSISVCLNEMDINVTNCNRIVIGGLVGITDNSSVTECINKGKLYASSEKETYIGGIVGKNSSTINNCKNIGDIIGNVSEDVFLNSTSHTNKDITSSVQSCSLDDKKIKLLGSNRRVNATLKVNYALTNDTDKGVVTNENIINRSGLEYDKPVYLGGIVGSNSGTIKNCYNDSKVYSESLKKYIVIYKHYTNISLEVNKDLWLRPDIGDITENSRYEWWFTTYSLPNNINSIYGKDTNYTNLINNRITNNYSKNKCNSAEILKNVNFTPTLHLVRTYTGNENYYTVNLSKNITYDGTLKDSTLITEAVGYGIGLGIYVSYLSIDAYGYVSGFKVNYLLRHIKEENSTTYIDIENCNVVNQLSDISKDEKYNNLNEQDFLTDFNTLNSSNKWYKGNDDSYNLKCFSWIHSIMYPIRWTQQEKGIA